MCASDPIFADAAADDLHIESKPPCVDAANGTYAPLTDIEGYSQIDDPNVPNTRIGDPNFADIGAYEYQP